MPLGRPGSSSSPPLKTGVIDKLDYKPGGTPLLHDHSNDSEPATRQSDERSYAGSFFSEVAEGMVDEDRRRISKEVLRYLSFLWAIINCLGAGSITAYSLYAPLFQRRLRYSQLQVNGVSITAELAMYLPVPIFGLLCDRFGPGVPSLLSGCFFGFGYLLAAFTYKSGPPVGKTPGAEGWPYWVMVIAFIGVGMGTSCMYLSAVTTCAKNFGRGKYKGLALALPIACFGLSGMWQSQIGSQLLHEQTPDGTKGDVDVHRYFLFLGSFLLAIGFVGLFALRVVGEEELIDRAVDELERSGLLENSDFFQRRPNSGHVSNGYGTDTHDERDMSPAEIDEMRREADEAKLRQLEEQRKKTWLLNEETRRFLSDGTMWWLAAGFFLVTGPGEAFINNLGTIIGTLYPPPTAVERSDAMQQTSAATHVSIVAITSTVARIVTGTLTDLFAPSGAPHQHRRGPNSLSNSFASLAGHSSPQLSRMTFLIAFSILMSIGQLLLATGALQGHGNLFWLVTASIGAGYGAIFSLTPIIVSVVWGVENFGTNWGIVSTVPAVGATVWGLVYSAVYQGAAARQPDEVLGRASGISVVTAQQQQQEEDLLCYGAACYAPTFWAMVLSVWCACGLFLWAWRGPGGWWRRGISI